MRDSKPITVADLAREYGLQAGDIITLLQTMAITYATCAGDYLSLDHENRIREIIESRPHSKKALSQAIEEAARVISYKDISSVATMLSQLIADGNDPAGKIIRRAIVGESVKNELYNTIEAQLSDAIGGMDKRLRALAKFLEVKVPKDIGDWSRKAEDRLAALETKATEVGDLYNRLKSKTSHTPEVTALQEDIRNLRKEIASTSSLLHREIDQLRDSLGKGRELPREVATQWSALVRHANSPPDKTGPLSLPSAAELVQRAQGLGFFLNTRTAQDIIYWLDRKRLLVIAGASGMGKSHLARILQRIILGIDFVEDPSVAVTVESDQYTGRNLTGSVWAYGDNLGPSIGPLTKAVIQRDAAGHARWLVINEANRCDPDALFQPLFPFLNFEQDSFLHPYVYATRTDPSGAVLVPEDFRVVVTINEGDLKVLPFSDALRNRCGYVKIQPPDRAQEYELMLKALHRFELSVRSTAAGFLVDLAIQLRKFTDRASTGALLSIARDLIKDTAAKPNVVELIDFAVGRILIPRLRMERPKARILVEQELKSRGLENSVADLRRDR